jgi:hypothetical protein
MRSPAVSGRSSGERAVALAMTWVELQRHGAHPVGGQRHLAVDVLVHHMGGVLALEGPLPGEQFVRA